MNALKTSLPIAAVLIWANTSSTLAALTQSPDDQTPGNPEQVQRALAILPRVGTNQTPVMPTLPAISVAVQPGLTEGEDWLKVLHETLEDTSKPSMLAEGAFVLARPGILIHGPADLMIFVPNKETQQPGEGPVLLMPCQTLEQLQAQWTGQPVQLSGEIFTYHGRNQLLISAYKLGSSSQSSTDAADTTEPTSTSPTFDDPSSLEDDPAVNDLLEELAFTTKSNNDRTQASDQSEALGRRSQATASPSPMGLDEGTLILRKPARLVRSSSGAWTMVFDHDDPDSQDAIELIVLPCTTLMRMEQIAMAGGDAGQMLISGRIYTYKGTHYILPSLVQRLAPQGINTLQ